jgi:hypothetical protein
MKFLSVFCIIALGGASSADASAYRLDISGVVRTVSTVSNGVVSLEGAPGDVKVGDNFRFSTRILTTGVQPASLYDADPRINIYNLAVSPVDFSAGSFRRRGFTTVSDLQLWDNYFVSSNSPSVDAFSPGSFRRLTNFDRRPFDVGSGEAVEGFYAYFFDFSGQARVSDSISEIGSLDLFPSRSFSYIIQNSANQYSVVLLTDIQSASISTVPEPFSWLMMLMGFGAVGIATRRHNLLEVRLAN